VLTITELTEIASAARRSLFRLERRVARIPHSTPSFAAKSRYGAKLR
jgi:hypothetical protein